MAAEPIQGIADGESGPTGSQRLTLIVLLIVVCTLVLIAHLPVLSARALCFDDEQYLVHNLLIQSPGWTSSRRFVTEVFEPSSVRGYYQPLTMISLMIDYALGGRSEYLIPFHRTSLLLHIFNTALVVVLLHLLFGQPWAAAGAGLLFGLHPMTVETIAWVAERKTLLASFFALCSLVFYMRFVKEGRSWARWSCLVMYVMALTSKPTSVPLPVLMLLMDYWPLRRANRAAVLEKLPLFVVGGVFAIITYVSQKQTAGVVLPHQYGPWRIPLVVCHNIIFYMGKIVWPVRLSSYYPFPRLIALSHPAILTGVIGTCALVPLLLVSLRWTRGIITGWLFFFLAILPTMQVITFSIAITADKYAYLPSAGFLMLIAWLLASVHAKTVGARSIAPRAALIMCVVVVAGAEALGTRRHIEHWRDSASLHEHMLALTPHEAPLHNYLGLVSESKRQFNKSVYHYRLATEINPRSPDHQQNLGIALSKIGQPKQALKHLREAVHLNEDHLSALKNLAWILATHPDPAVRNAEESLQLAKRASHLTSHRSAGVLDALAAAWAANGYFDEAVATAKKALWVTSMTNQKKMAEGIRERLELYQEGMPHRQDPEQQDTEYTVDVSQEESETKHNDSKERPL